jgi:hypothetical protein
MVSHPFSRISPMSDLEQLLIRSCSSVSLSDTAQGRRSYASADGHETTMTVLTTFLRVGQAKFCAFAQSWTSGPMTAWLPLFCFSRLPASRTALEFSLQRRHLSL